MPSVRTYRRTNRQSRRRLWLTLGLLLLALSCLGMVASSVTERQRASVNVEAAPLNGTQQVAATVSADGTPAPGDTVPESATMVLFGTALLSVAAIMHRHRTSR